MIYAKAFRRGDGFYPQNAIFQDLMLLCIVWQGIDWLRRKAGQGHCCHCRRLVLALCGGRISAAFPRGAGDAHRFDSRGICHHFHRCPCEQHYGRRLELFLPGACCCMPRVDGASAADGMGTGDFPVISTPALGMACRQAGFVWTQMFTAYYEWFGVAAVLLMLLYNGQRGSGHKQLFYWFYPAHVYLLYGASCLLYNVLR